MCSYFQNLYITGQSYHEQNTNLFQFTFSMPSTTMAVNLDNIHFYKPCAKPAKAPNFSRPLKPITHSQAPCIPTHSQRITPALSAPPSVLKPLHLKHPLPQQPTPVTAEPKSSKPLQVQNDFDRMLEDLEVVEKVDLTCEGLQIHREEDQSLIDRSDQSKGP